MSNHACIGIHIGIGSDSDVKVVEAEAKKWQIMHICIGTYWY